MKMPKEEIKLYYSKFQQPLDYARFEYVFGKALMGVKPYQMSMDEMYGPKQEEGE